MDGVRTNYHYINLNYFAYFFSDSNTTSIRKAKRAENKKYVRTKSMSYDVNGPVN